MNNSKMWLVVKPTVGVPLFLSAVAVGSFAVHVAVLSNTTWVSDFLSGKELGAMSSAAVIIDDPDTNTANASFVTPETVSATGAQEVLVTMPDGTQRRAVLQPAGESL
ncbi:light-harvesting protein [uncultured Litoreibacter sp.]|uniref:light-harvesting protein n=1 Tax=uncultured Litoreibacter sp. TaxID=1392394 RepID=UPI00261E4D2A|nr:light-harvesting protein [uncultured Litoreibacter sp.]